MGKYLLSNSENVCKFFFPFKQDFPPGADQVFLGRNGQNHHYKFSGTTFHTSYVSPKASPKAEQIISVATAAFVFNGMHVSYAPYCFH